jgi:hypothetical protein
MVPLLAGLIATACVSNDAPEAEQGRRHVCDAVECDIELEHVVTLSDSFAPGAFTVGRPLWVQQDARGRFFLPVSGLDQVLVFDSTGRFHSYIGRRGSGPGEFERATHIFTGYGGDSVYVADVLLKRLTMIAPDLSIARTRSLAYTPSLYMPDLVLDDGSFILAVQVQTPDHIGYPIHRLDSVGAIVRSFGIDTPQFRPDLSRLLTRVVAPSRGGGIWAAAPGRYIIDRWDPDSGRREARIIVPSPWFRESDRSDRQTEHPHPVIVGLWEDEHSLLWVLLRDGNSEWRPPEQPVHAPRDPESYSNKHDWVIEVIDPVSGQVVASRRFPDYIGYRPPTALLVSIREIELAGVVLDVWRPVLQARGGSS